ncbi:TetR family transcriptional regulator [Actinomadura decatromicini]|uniref:TetR family transcriptional regulator n=2 Tax=Actinomadura decatromicini TaxID=2604572 RepID=A0A5D3F6L3_9ACTN|nr:TetR family transcriptional regulator [Actinomadura decatromicini]
MWLDHERELAQALTETEPQAPAPDDSPRGGPDASTPQTDATTQTDLGAQAHDPAQTDDTAWPDVAARTDHAARAEVAARAVARFALDRLRPRGQDDPRRVIEAAFTLLANGWPAPELSRPASDRAPAVARSAAPAGPPGLRERKKAQTRRAIIEAAVALFTERGYDNVGVREIADAADTSIATLFKYFPDGKVSLVFPGDRAARIASLTDAVHDRAPGQTVLDALRGLLSQRGPFKEDPTPAEQRVLDLVSATPDLRDYALRSWTNGQDALAAAIAEESGLPADDLTARLLARYVLQIPDLARNTPDPRRTLDIVIDLLSRGWPACLHES